MHRTLLSLMILPLCAFAQDPALQRGLIQRDQQSDAFRLQLRQWQERLALPPGDLARQQQAEARQIAERQRLEGASEAQLRDVQADIPATLRPYERQKAADERRPLVTPDAP